MSINGVFSVLATAMHSDTARINNVAYNLANVSTPAFKRVFNSEFDTGNNSMQIDRRQGGLMPGGSPMEIAIEGDGFLAVGEGNNSALSRGGLLKVDQEGRLLLAQSGRLVQDISGAGILLEPGGFTVKEDGSLQQNDETVAQLNLVYPDKQGRMETLGEGLYHFAGDFEQEVEQPGRILQGFTEKANINTVQEMVRLMEATRHFESTQRAVQGIDTMWEKTLRTLGEV